MDWCGVSGVSTSAVQRISQASADSHKPIGNRSRLLLFNLHAAAILKDTTWRGQSLVHHHNSVKPHNLRCTEVASGATTADGGAALAKQGQMLELQVFASWC